MIIESRRGDILASHDKHIMFAGNTEGVHDSGLAGQVAYRFWPELARVQPRQLGTVVSNTISDGRTLHAVICHSLAPNGWRESPGLIEKALVMIQADEISTVMIGCGPVGAFQGAPGEQILDVMARSSKKITIYTL